MAKLLVPARKGGGVKNGSIERVKAARAKGRPTGTDFIHKIFTDFTELHGDRRFGDDKAVVAASPGLYGMPVTVIALERGHDTTDKIIAQLRLRSPGRVPQGAAADEAGGKVPPAGYLLCRHLRRLLRQLPPRSAGQGEAIAENLMEMMTLKTPVISVLIGEGGSGGALGLAVADEVWMLENAVYSVISPEGCASILWKDSSKVKEAASCLRMTAEDLLQLGVIERVIPEGHNQFEEVYQGLKTDLYEKISQNAKLPIQQLLENRYNRFRRMGAGNG